MHNCLRRCARGCGSGHDACHVSEIDLTSATDATIANHVARAQQVLITKDEDFVTLRLPDRYALVWLRCGNATNRALTVWLESRWPRIEVLLDAGERFIEAR